MTISLDVPTAGDMTGPGYFFVCSTSIVGPLNPDTAVSVLIHRLPDTGIVQSFIFPPSTESGRTGYLGWDAPPATSGTQVNEGEAFGSDCTVELLYYLQSNNAVVDGPTNFTGMFYDPYGQLVRLIANIGNAASGGGFTANDRTLLTQVNVAAVINAYNDAAVHGGLTGNGELQLGASTRAIRTQITQYPPAGHATSGLPPYNFNLGFITPRTLTSWAKSSRLTFDTQLFTVSDSTTSISWSLPDSLVLSELDRATV